MSGMAALLRSARQARGVAAVAVAAVVTSSFVSGCGAAHRRAGAITPGTAGGASGDLTGSTTTSTTTTSPGTARSGAATTVASRPSGGTGSSASTGSGAPQPAAPGTYTVDQSGGVTTNPSVFSATEPPQGTLVVDPAQSDGEQVWHRYVDSKNPPADTTTQYRSNGPFILSATEAGPQGNTSCTFDPPIAAPPWPPAAGDTFSSVGNCGSFTVSVRGRIAGTQTVTLKDGETFTAWVIDSTLNIDSSNQSFSGSGTQVDWYSPAVRLPLHEQVDVSGKYNGVSFQLHSVSDLVSSHPS